MRWSALAVTALMLALALPPGEAQQAPITLALTESPLRFSSVDVRVDGVPLGPNLVANPSFPDSSAGWRLTTSEVGAGGSIVQDGGSLLFRADLVQKNGTLHAMQQVTKPDTGPLLFSYEAASVGRDPMAAEFILRERGPGGPVDTTLKHALTPSMETYEWTLVPKVAGGDVQVFLRVRGVVGKEQAARVDDVELRTGPRVDWAVDGGSVVSSGGLSARVAFDRLGSATVTATGSREGAVQWTASRVVEVANAAPAARLSTSPLVPAIGVPFLLDASGSSDGDSTLRVQDPGFERLGTAWQLSGNKETGGSVSSTSGFDAFGRPELSLSVSGAERNGTVFASQTVPVQRPGPATFSVGIRDGGGIQRYAFILRERNATGATADATYAFDSTQGRPSVASMLWEPQRTDTVALQVFLRFRVLAGASAEVAFAQPSLQSGLEFSYFLDGRLLGTSRNATFPVTLPDLAAHEASVEVADADGGRSVAILPLRANDPGYLWSPRGGPVAPLAPATAFDATATRRADSLFNHLRNADFSEGKSGWALGKGETGGSVRWSVERDGDSSFARLSVQGNATGSNFLVQELDRRCLSMACTFSFQARLVSGDATLEPILRASVQPPGQERRSVDLKWSPPLGPAWGYGETAWSPPVEDVVGLEAFLRVRTPANGSAVVDFRDPHLGPERAYTWTFGGPSGNATYAGAVVRPRFDAPGPRTAEVRLATGLGLGGSHAFTVDVLPVEFFRAQGGLAARVGPSAPAGSSLALLAADGAELWSLPLAEPGGAGGPAAFAEGGSTYLLLDPPADATVALGNGTARGAFRAADLAAELEPALGPIQVGTRHRGWDTVLHVNATSGDLALRFATVTVRSGDRVLASARAAPGPGGLAADLPMPTGWQARDVSVAVALTDGWGFETVHSAPATVGRNPLLVSGTAVLGLAAALALAGVAARALQLRRRPPA